MNLTKLSDYWQRFFLIWSDQKKRQAFIRWLKANAYRLIPVKSSAQIEKLHHELVNDSSWGTDFIVCTIISCLIATFGLLSNSSAVIIGAMLVAPLMLPLRGLAFSASEGDFQLFRKAVLSILGATLLSIAISIFITKIISFTDVGSEVSSRTQPNLIDLGIAVSAGAMSGFGKIRPGISDTLAGTAIAVALMPPLCVVGISLIMADYPSAMGAFLLYVTNLLGIILACMIVFIVTGYTKLNRTAVGWASFLTFILIIPLGASFFRLLDQQRIEEEITNSLINETYTIGQDVENVVIKVLWNRKKPTVYVTLQTEKQITSRQVQLTEKYLNRTLKRDFELVLLISPLTRITGQEQETEIKIDNIVVPPQNSSEQEDIDILAPEEEESQEDEEERDMFLPQYRRRTIR